MFAKIAPIQGKLELDQPLVVYLVTNIKPYTQL